MKVLIVLSFVAVALASLEPAGYRPPGSSAVPSARYLPASQHSSSFSSIPPNQYLPASRYSSAGLDTPSNQYLPASRYSADAHQETPSNRYLPAGGASSGSLEAPSSQYLPAAVHNGASVPQWAINAGSSGSRYAAPSSQFHGPAQRYNAAIGTPSNVYLPASESRYSSGSYSPASSASSSSYSSLGSAPSSRYLPAYVAGSSNGYRYSSAGEESSVPAKYEFEYEVKDEPTGNDFGHKESRDGDNTQGVYSVVLPDGRKQVVQYEADQEGYKPRISYEDLKQGYNGAYNRNAGYPQGPY